MRIFMMSRLHRARWLMDVHFDRKTGGGIKVANLDSEKSFFAIVIKEYSFSYFYIKCQKHLHNLMISY